MDRGQRARTLAELWTKRASSLYGRGHSDEFDGAWARPEGLAELSRWFRAGLDGIGLASGAQHRRTCIEGLREVADARGDVDAFIEAQRLAGVEDRAMMPIAEGLVAAGRLDEALQRLERAAGGEHRSDGLDDLRIEVLDRLGRADDAQAVRWGVFLRTLSKQHAR